MNILGYISAILIIFSIISSYMFKQHMDTSEMNKSMKGYYLADIQSKNEFEDFMYDAQNKKKKSPKDQTSKNSPISNDTQKQNEYISDEEQQQQQIKDKKPRKIYACSCINILPLIKNNKIEEKQTYDLLIKLITILYKNELTKDKIEYKLVDQLLIACNKKIEKKESLCLEKIDLKDPSLQPLWYKMLKGTKYYDFEKDIGLPSILEFISIDENEKHNKICIPTASKEILIALFDEKIADKIWDKKEKDKIKITKEELENILKDTHTSINNQSNIWAYIELSHKNHKKNASQIICQDEISQISIRRFCRDQ